MLRFSKILLTSCVIFGNLYLNHPTSDRSVVLWACSLCQALCLSFFILHSSSEAWIGYCLWTRPTQNVISGKFTQFFKFLKQKLKYSSF